MDHAAAFLRLMRGSASDPRLSMASGSDLVRESRGKDFVGLAIEAGVGWPMKCRSTSELDQLRAHLSALMTYRVAAKELQALVQRQGVAAAQAPGHAVRRANCQSCSGRCHVKDYRDQIATLFG